MQLCNNNFSAIYCGAFMTQFVNTTLGLEVNIIFVSGFKKKITVYLLHKVQVWLPN
jgi:hypothetical protein